MESIDDDKRYNQLSSMTTNNLLSPTDSLTLSKSLENKKNNQTLTLRIPLSIDTFDAANRQGAIESPRSRQAASNLQITLEDLYLVSNEAIKILMEQKGLNTTNEFQVHVYKENLEKIRRRQIDEVKAERDRIDIDGRQSQSRQTMGSSANRREEIFAMTSTSFFLNPERQTQKLEQIKKQQERELYLLIQEEARVQQLQDELNGKFENMIYQQNTMKEHRDQIKAQNENLRQQKDDRIKQNQLDQIQKKENDYAAKLDKERQKMDRDQRKFMIRSQIQKSLSEDKEVKQIMANSAIKRAQENQQLKSDQIQQKRFDQEKQLSEQIEFQQQQQMHKIQFQRQEYEKRLEDINTRIQQMEEQLMIKTSNKQRIQDNKMVERELEKQQKQEYSKYKSDIQTGLIKQAQLRKQEGEQLRERQIVEAMKNSDQNTKEFEQYQKQILMDKQILTNQCHERFNLKKERIEKQFADIQFNRHQKTMMAQSNACFNVQKQRQDMTEYLAFLDQRKFQNLKTTQDKISNHHQNVQSDQIHRTLTSLQNANDNAHLIKQDSVDNLISQGIVRQMNFQSNINRIKLKEQSNRDRIIEISTQKQTRLNTLETEKTRNQQTFLQQALKIQLDHQELRVLYQKSKTTHKFEDVQKYIETHQLELSPSVSQVFFKSPMTRSQVLLDATKVNQIDVQQHGDHTHIRSEIRQFNSDTQVSNRVDDQ